ncbi:MAG: helix-turn-helix domain-containing protein [Actinomycetes bacterium]
MRAQPGAAGRGIRDGTPPEAQIGEPGNAEGLAEAKLLVDLTALFLNYEPPGQETLLSSDVADPVAPHAVRRVDRLGQEKALELVALYIEGLSVSQLASQYGVNITTVRNQLKTAEVEMRPFRKLSPQQTMEVCRLHADGTPLAELARVFGVSTSTIKRMLVEAGGS